MSNGAPVLDVPALIVIGGGVDGAFYVRQLVRAVTRGRLRTSRIVVVDRRKDCEAAAFGAPVEIAAAEWSPWLAAHLAGFDAEAHLVPYHWAPHLLGGWLAGEVARAGGAVEAAGPALSRGLPFESETRGGDRALSYASWPCPPACIEPRHCPHTGGPRDWSLAADLHRPAPGEADEAVVLPSLHLVWGVGSIPLRAILAARARLLAAVAGPPRTFLVATASHCHGLAQRLRVSRASSIAAVHSGFPG